MDHQTFAFVPEDRRHTLFTGTNLLVQQEGTVLFADISGSSRMTDELINTLGPTQAVDRLTTLLNSCFTALIEQVHLYGGAVISFGGDGILAIFPEDDGSRALTTAFLMQKAIANFSNYTINAKISIALALKVAVAHGPFQRVAIGDPTIQLLEIVVGAAVGTVSIGWHRSTYSWA